jgi:hypothetical protein
MPIDVLRIVGLRAARGTVRRTVLRGTRIWIWFLIQKSIKKILIEAGRIEGIAATAMRQRQPGRGPDIRRGDFTTTLPRRVSSRCSCGHDIGSHAVDLESATDSGDRGQLPIIQLYRR